MSDPQSVAGAYAKIESHEELCAERYARIFESLGDLKDNAGKQSTLLWGVLLSVAGFTVITLIAVMLHALKLT